MDDRAYFLKSRIDDHRKPRQTFIPFGATFQTQWTNDDVFQVCGNGEKDPTLPACTSCDFKKLQNACAFFMCSCDARQDGREVCAIKVRR